MDRDERQRLQATIAEVDRWVKRGQELHAERAAITRNGERALQELRDALVEVPRNGRPAWTVLPLSTDDDARVRSIAWQRNLPAIAAEDAGTLRQLSEVVPNAIRESRALFGVRRLFSGRSKKDAAGEAAAFLTGYRAWAIDSGLPAALDRLAPNWADDRHLTSLDVLSDEIGAATRIAPGLTGEIVDATSVAGLPEAIDGLGGAVKSVPRFRQAAIDAGDGVRDAETRRLLAAMPIERLKEATRDRLRLAPLTDAGLRTVLDVIDYRGDFADLPGIGEASGLRIRGAAQTLRQITFDEMPARIDIRTRTTEATEFLRRLGQWDAARNLTNATADLQRAGELTGLARALTRDQHHLVVFSGYRSGTREFLAGVDAVIARAASVGVVPARGSRIPVDPWDDFLARPADYFGMLTELGFMTADENKTHGDLPEEIVDAVRAIALDTEHLRVASLRGYQSFAARFALVQRKVIIGDEMGLGKTVEALAVLAHLRSEGHHHAVVVCPAAVVTNWTREIESKSSLTSHRVHGPGRDGAARSWLRTGGVAVTTFGGLDWFLPRAKKLEALGCVVVDEAHYIKNPAAKRSVNAGALMRHTERAVLLTGTPLENRLDEFAHLVRLVRPGLAVDTSGLSPATFRRQVAPAYLRRNQEDVLTELPDLVEMDELLPMSTADAAAYAEAVASGNFQAMRQAAMLGGAQSRKVRRLRRIVEEAGENGRRVIVFSNFRAVLDRLVRELPGTVFGPLTGSVPAAHRQRMVDEFSASGGGAVLVSQIVAGGVGLNIQAASVVVLCEPQLKPTTEWQAIARAHRMGQLESVQVHRLLSEEGVDQRITEILARKSALFDEFARVSATADSAPEAFDVTEAELAREIVAAERERLFAAPKESPAQGAPADEAPNPIGAVG